MFTLPESVKYLMGWPHRRSELLATVRRLRRDLSISQTAQFVDSVTPQVMSFAPGQLFRGGLAWITPLLWVCFASALINNFFLNSWLPLIFVDGGLVPRQAGVATSLYHYGGLVGGVLVSLALARFGFAVIALLFLLAVAAIGLPGGSYITMATTTGTGRFLRPWGAIREYRGGGPLVSHGVSIPGRWLGAGLRTCRIDSRCLTWRTAH